MKNYHNYF